MDPNPFLQLQDQFHQLPKNVLAFDLKQPFVLIVQLIQPKPSLECVIERIELKIQKQLPGLKYCGLDQRRYREQRLLLIPERLWELKKKLNLKRRKEPKKGIDEKRPKVGREPLDRETKKSDLSGIKRLI